jgi:translin
MALPDFKELRKDMELLDIKREELFDKSRGVIKLSKTVIYAVQRNDLASASKYAAEIKKAMDVLRKVAKNNPYANGNIKAAAQEYVEALCFLEYSLSKKILTKKDLDVSTEEYLLGLCDLSGELVRKAINASIKGDFSTSLEIKEVVAGLYAELMLFDFRNSELRKKFDGIKYDLRKLEDLALAIRMKNG